MHAFTRHQYQSSSEATNNATKGLVLKGGWRYDLHGWFLDTCLFLGQGRKLRQRALTLGHLQPGETVLDVGCGTGTLALEVARLVGRTGHVVGIDPSSEQLARARAKAARRHLSIEFQTGVIEQLAFPDQTFDVVFSTLMMHHLPQPLKQQGLAETARVLKPGGRLVIADFTHKQERVGRAAHFHAGGSRIHDLTALVSDADFQQLETEELQAPRFSTFPGASIVRAYKSCVK